MRRRACLCDLRASVERACGPHYDRWPVTPSPQRRERPPAPSRFPPNETFARVFVPDNIRPSQHTNATRSFQSKLKKIARATSETNGTGEKRIFEDRGGREREREKEGRFRRSRERERESRCRGILRSECKTMQRRVEGNRRGLLRGAVVGVARAWWWGEGAASSGRTGAPFHVAPRWGASGLSLFHSLRGLFPRRQAGGKRGRRGTVDAGRGGAAYDPARRVPRVSSYTLPRTIDNEPWRTAVVYCREFFG